VALQQIVEQTVTGLGYDLVEIERSAGGLLRITIDLPWQAPEEGAPELPEQFVTVEDCERSRASFSLRWKSMVRTTPAWRSLLQALIVCCAMSRTSSALKARRWI
jgi:hypothetical protein